MTNSFLQRVLVPIANPDDAAATTAALTPYVFTPRGASRWKKLLAGDVTHNLPNNSDIPIPVFPHNIDATGVENPEENNQPASRS